MYKKVSSVIVILVFVVGMIYFLSNHNPVTVANPYNTNQDFSDISTETIWNAYTFDNTVFIYPADWLFEEIREQNSLDNQNTQNFPQNSPSQITGFKVTYPAGSNTNDFIEVNNKCAVTTLQAESHSFCLGDILIYTQSQNGAVVDVYENMKTFIEKNNHA